MKAGPDGATALLEAGLACWQQSRLDDAEAHLAAAADLFAGLDRPFDAARCRANLGLVAKSRGRLAQALFLLDGVRPAFEQHGGELDSARLDLNRASLLCDLGRYDEARGLAARCGARLRDYGRVVEAAQALWIDAAAAEGLRLYEEALAVYREAAALLRDAGAADEAAAIGINVGEIYRRLGDVELALGALAEAERDLPEGRSPHRATLELNRAAALVTVGREAEALTAVDAAAVMFAELDCPRDRAEAELLRARLLLARGDCRDAQRVLLDARGILAREGAPIEVAGVDLQLAELGLTLDLAPLVEMTCRGVLDQVPPAYADLHQRAWRLLMRLAERHGDEAAALDRGRRALEAAERLGAGVRHDLIRQRFDQRPDLGELVGAMLRLLAARGDGAEALSILQRAKARAMVDDLGVGPRLEGEADDAWRRAEQAASARINELLAAADRLRGDEAGLTAWREDLETARAELTGLHLALAATAPDAALLRGVLPEPVDAERIAAVVGPRGAVIETYVAGDDLFLVAALEGGSRLVARPGGARELAARLDALRAGLRLLVGSPAELRPRLLPGLVLAGEVDGQALFDLLLEPFADVIDGADNLVIAPHGRLWDLPPAMLHDGLDPLVARLPCALVPSAAALCRLAARPARRAVGALAVGGDARRLTAVAGELDGLGADGARVLAGAEATRAAVLDALGAAGVIHFAGHAEYRAESPLFSALRLADGERVTAGDLYAARLRADLVTLAGCETGRRPGETSGELVGLARAVLHAGARAVIASLWPVPDTATARLMSDVRRHLRAGRSAAEALRAAADAVRGEVLHPFYWAGFALIGLPGVTVPAQDNAAPA